MPKKGGINMNDVKAVIAMIGERLKKLAQSNAVVSKPISFGDRHVLPLCELSIGFGAGGGTSEGEANQDKSSGQGSGGGVGGAAKAAPMAVVIVDGKDVRIETLGR
jgi:uncharacterized spore protein YtfJ